MLWKLLDTEFDYAVCFVRFGIGTVALVHEYDNLMHNAGADLLISMGIPWFLAWVILIGLFINALALVLGFFTRIASAIFLFTAVSDVIRLTLYRHFFMIWEMSIGARDMEGVQFHLLILSACLILIIKGAGACSIDEYLVNKVDWDYIRVVWLNR